MEVPQRNAVPHYPTVIERAFELARSGQYAGVHEIRKQLLAERFVVLQLTGPVLLKQLRRACAEARGDPARSPGEVRSLSSAYRSTRSAT